MFAARDLSVTVAAKGAATVMPLPPVAQDVPQLHESPGDYLRLMRMAVPLYDRLQEEIVRASAGVSVSCMLDLGAGTGETARRCLAAHPNARVVLVDASAAMLGVAARDLGSAAEVHIGRLEDPLPEGQFDLIVSALAVHHLDSRAKADLFARVARRLSRGGRFVVGDIIATDRRVSTSSPADFPDAIDDQLEWLRGAGFEAECRWTDADLAVLVGRPNQTAASRNAQ